MSFIVISDPLSFEHESELINLLFETGMPLFHLRKPGMDIDSYAKLISLIDSSYHNRIALHQFHELVSDFALIKRLHYPEKLRTEGCKYEQDNVLSTSIHSLNELDKLQSFDYAFYGPVFNSISKPGYIGLDVGKLELPAGNKRIKLIALGGIELDKVEKVKLIGFDGLAVLGTIWRDKKQAVFEIKSLIDKYNETFN
ncbi:thiamine phosphate synthase [Pedobacter nyackensis]|uniref:thiamine phosphate synthase n=1 Tax=Pedobacter nyackensis TaxID=475255 RepID=UPI00292D1AB7|nr:thiamine phosphate synthase [Pedobacter nyackensis]